MQFEEIPKTVMSKNVAGEAFWINVNVLKPPSFLEILHISCTHEIRRFHDHIFACVNCACWYHQNHVDEISLLVLLRHFATFFNWFEGTQFNGINGWVVANKKVFLNSATHLHPPPPQNKTSLPLKAKDANTF